MRVVKILNKNFNTKREAEDFTRVILYKYEDGKPLQNEDFEFVIELVNRHPDSSAKKGVGIKDIITGPDKKFGTTRCFYIIREDNTSIDFSFKKCFSYNPNDPLKLFKTAARRAIEKDIVTFKHVTFSRQQDENGKIKCALSGELVDKENADVDHTPPDTFDKIVTAFILQKNINIDAVTFTSGDDYKFSKAFSDKNLSSEFASYHNQVCNLRIVTRKENLKQKKKNW